MPPLGQSLEEEDLKKLQNDLNQFVQVQPEPAPQFGEAEYQDALHALGTLHHLQKLIIILNFVSHNMGMMSTMVF
ncbi:hypothetical protein DPMN_119854 [Dreissena polymorpha]|uniref:Uncharacterized protein n=1 Tax=Dreissena polymorpha TaxID=45954 RepID=A0A9D4JRM6_DREPO|nr:hypothetical protein DPMN_119854 [Dreissena polymorpha]